MKLRDLVLSQFEPDVALALLEFGKSLRKIDADVFIFFARKSLCLYDVLVKIGVPPIERCVVSDRILDGELQSLERKKVALIDDTLIVGTTIAKAKDRLQKEVEAKVSTHVFCVDRDWHSPELARPDTVALHLPDNRVMTFCAAEVRALSLVPRPYLVDFPLASGLRIQNTDIDGLLSLTDWVGTRLSTRLQEQHGVHVFTFFPADDTLVDLRKHFGEAVFSAVDLLKVRVFAREYQGVYHVTVVPIATLRPLKEKTVHNILFHLLTRIEKASGKDISQLWNYVTSPISHQRLAQYILSVSIGERFFQSLQTFVKRGAHWTFDDFEAARHYGPWIGKELSIINQCSFDALRKVKHAVEANRFSVASIPKDVHSWTHEILPRGPIKYTKSELKQSIIRSNLLATFAGVFLRLYDKREIPARQEAKELGKYWLDPSRRSPNKDRLESGITWEMLVDWLTRRMGVKPTNRIRNVLSLMLDYCNDLGISVPVTCCKGGIVFRAYRHGEDVRFSDSELALAYHLVAGFLETSGSADVPRLILEKMLVLLFKIGVVRGFLDPLYGHTGTDGIGKVKFDLMGARPLLRRGPRACKDRDIWLTDYLVEREVLKESKKTSKDGKIRRGKYSLDRLPAGNFTRSHAPDDAYELGSLIGMLTSPSSEPLQKAALTDEGLMLLATCASAHSAANALQVELYIVQTWFEQEGCRTLRKLKWDSITSIKQSYERWVSGNGHFGLYSAKVKYLGYVQKKCSKINQECAEYLRKTQKNAILSRRWQSFWNSDSSQATKEKEMFEPHIHSAALLVWKSAALFSVVEIALCYHMVAENVRGAAKLLGKAFSKLRNYRETMLLVGAKEPHIIAQICKRFEELNTLQQTEFVLTQDGLVLNHHSPSAAHPFNPKVATTFAHQELATLMEEIGAFVDRMDPLLEEFGRTSAKRDYKYMLYYDVTDSSATFAGRSGADIADYRRRVSLFKEAVNRWFNTNIIIAKKRNVEIFAWNGDKDSTNDCKYVFFSGSLCRRFVESTVKMLLRGCQDYGGLKVRIEIVPCNFVGTNAFRLNNKTEVDGPRFWEYYSRLHKRVGDLEKAIGLNTATMFVATDELKNELKIDDFLRWKSERFELTSEIEMLSKITPGYFGPVQLK